MEYRKMPHGGAKVSVIGMGSSVVGEQKEEDIIRTVQYALDAGVNYFDMAGGHATIFPAYGKALAGQREKAMLQVHFGADYTSGEYGWTTNLEQVKRSVDWQLKNLQTDYIDVGFIHCLDEAPDLSTYEKHGILKYVLGLKDQGQPQNLDLEVSGSVIPFLLRGNWISGWERQENCMRHWRWDMQTKRHMQDQERFIRMWLYGEHDKKYRGEFL